MVFALSKWPHLHRAYLVTVCNQNFIAVFVLEPYLQSQIRILLSTEQEARTFASLGDQIMSSTEAVWPFKGFPIDHEAASGEGFHT